MTISKIKTSRDAFGKKIRIIPTIGVFSNRDDIVVHEEHLKNFNKDLCRKILIEYYGFYPTENLW